MYNSIIQFIEKDTQKIENILKKNLLSGNMMRFEKDLLDIMLEFGRGLYQEILESIEETIKNSDFRKLSFLFCFRNPYHTRHN